MKANKGGEALHVPFDDSLVSHIDRSSIKRVTRTVHAEVDVALRKVQRGGRQSIPPKLTEQLLRERKQVRTHNNPQAREQQATSQGSSNGA